MPASNQHRLFVGGYAAADQPGIRAYVFDEATAELRPCGAIGGIVNPSFLVVHPNGRWLYSVGETHREPDGAAGSVWAFHFEQPAASEQLMIAPLNQQASGGDDPCHLLIDGSGRWLIVSNYSSGSVGVLPIRDDGSLGAMTDHVQHIGRSAHEQRQEGPHAHSAVMTPDQRFVIVADLGIDQLVFYAFDAALGKLTAHGHSSTRPGAGPRHMVFHPDGQHLFVANELDSTLDSYAYDRLTGTLRPVQTLPTIPTGTQANQVADIHVDAAGKRVYVSNRGHNSIAVFDVNHAGALTPVMVAPCGGNWPRNFAITPGGTSMVVANQYSGDVSVLPLDSGTSALGAPVAQIDVPQASCVQFLTTYD